MAKVTPMMEQYFEIKNKYRHCLLFYRLGVFYEMFFEDAIITSRELGLTLTGRDWGQKERAPMCGVPYHSADSYIDKLVNSGYKVAICEQVEDPKKAKGIVKRDVVRVVTPGTVIDGEILEKDKNNYIMAIFADSSGYAIAVCDVSTGEFQTTQFTTVNAKEKLYDEVSRFNPSEIISIPKFIESETAQKISKFLNINIGEVDSRTFSYKSAVKMLLKHFNIKSINSLGLEDKTFSTSACGGLLDYLYDTQKNNLEHINKITLYTTSDFMILDSNSRRNLELTETMREKSRRGSLLWVIDKTQTAMGARMLRKWVEQPLKNSQEINKRLDSVDELYNNFFLREEVREVLKSMHDFERIMGRIIYKTANARELVNLRDSIEKLPILRKLLKDSKSEYLKEIYDEFDVLEDIYKLIEKSIVDEPPFSVREGGMIREGYSGDLDTLMQAKSRGSKWIKDLEEEEKVKTGIKNLKISYNRVFGYYIEITKSNINQAPDRYIRKQTLANAERYTTQDLDGIAETILGSAEKLVELEYNTFCEIRETIASQVNRIQFAAFVVAVIDSLQSLAETGQKQNYVKPLVNDSDVINVKDGRHPSVEKMSEEIGRAHV